MIEEIDLGKQFTNDLPEPLQLKDFTKYRIKGLNQYSISFNEKIAKWISNCDIDLEEFNIVENDEYICDVQNDGLLLIGAYCGKTSIKIKREETSEEKEVELVICSRFEKIEYNSLIQCIKNNDKAKEDWETMNKKGEILQIIEGKNSLYYMPALYEVFVRQVIREYLEDKNWILVQNPHESVCKGITTSYKKWDLSQGNMENVEVYLQGELIPDVVLKSKDKEEYMIFDVKYKNGRYNSGTRSDRLQILAYAYMWNCNCIGHIFPDKESEEILEIDIGNSEQIKYIELKCNNDSESAFHMKGL